MAKFSRQKMFSLNNKILSADNHPTADGTADCNCTKDPLATQPRRCSAIPSQEIPCRLWLFIWCGTGGNHLGIFPVRFATPGEVIDYPDRLGEIGPAVYAAGQWWQFTSALDFNIDAFVNNAGGCQYRECLAEGWLSGAQMA